MKFNAVSMSFNHFKQKVNLLERIPALGSLLGSSAPSTLGSHSVSVRLSSEGTHLSVCANGKVPSENNKVTHAMLDCLSRSKTIVCGGFSDKEYRLRSLVLSVIKGRYVLTQLI